MLANIDNTGRTVTLLPPKSELKKEAFMHRMKMNAGAKVTLAVYPVQRADKPGKDDGGKQQASSPRPWHTCERVPRAARRCFCGRGAARRGGGAQRRWRAAGPFVQPAHKRS